MATTRRPIDRAAILDDLHCDFQSDEGCAKLLSFVLEEHVRPVVSAANLSRYVPSSLYQVRDGSVNVVSEETLMRKMSDSLRATLLTGVQELHVKPLTEPELECTVAHLSSPTQSETAYGTAYRSAMVERARMVDTAKQLNEMLDRYRASARRLQRALDALFWHQFVAVISKRAFGACAQSLKGKSGRSTGSTARLKTAYREYTARAEAVIVDTPPTRVARVHEVALRESTLRLRREDLLFMLQRMDTRRAVQGDGDCSCHYIASRAMAGTRVTDAFKRAPILFSADRLFAPPGAHGTAQALLWTFAADKARRAQDAASKSADQPPDEWRVAAAAAEQFTVCDMASVTESLAAIPRRAPDGNYVCELLKTYVRKTCDDYKQVKQLTNMLEHEPELRERLWRLDAASVSFHHARRYADEAVAELAALHVLAREQVDAVANAAERIVGYGPHHRAFPALQASSVASGLAPYSAPAFGPVPLTPREHAACDASDSMPVEAQEGVRPEAMSLHQCREEPPLGVWAHPPAPVSHLVALPRAPPTTTVDRGMLERAISLVRQEGRGDESDTPPPPPDDLPLLFAFYRHLATEVLGWVVPDEHGDAADCDADDSPYAEYALNPTAVATLHGVSTRGLMHAQRTWTRTQGCGDPDQRCHAVFHALGLVHADTAPRREDSRSERLLRKQWNVSMPGLFLAVMFSLSRMPTPLGTRDSRLALGFYVATASACAESDAARIAATYRDFGSVLLGVDCSGRRRPLAPPDEMERMQRWLIARRAPLMAPRMRDPFREYAAAGYTRTLRRLEQLARVGARGFTTVRRCDDSDVFRNLSDDRSNTEPATQFVDDAHRLVASVHETPRLRALVSHAMEVRDAGLAQTQTAEPHVDAHRGAESIYLYTMSAVDFNRTFQLRVDVPETEALRATRMPARGPVCLWRAPQELCADADACVRSEDVYCMHPSSQPHSPQFAPGAGADWNDCTAPRPQLHAAPCAANGPYRAGRIELKACDTYLCDENGAATVLTDVAGECAGSWDASAAREADAEMTHGARMLTAPSPGAFPNVRRGDLVLIRVARANSPETPDFERRRKWVSRNPTEHDKYLCRAIDYAALDYVDDYALGARDNYCYVAVVHAVVPHAHVSVPLVNDDLASFRTGALLLSRPFPLPHNVALSPQFVDQCAEGIVSHSGVARGGVVRHIPGHALLPADERARPAALAGLYKTLYDAVQAHRPALSPDGTPAYTRTAGTGQLVPWYDRHAAAAGVSRHYYDSQQMTAQRTSLGSDDRARRAAVRESLHAFAEAIAPLIGDPRDAMNYSSQAPLVSLHDHSMPRTLPLNEVPQRMRIVVVTLSPERLAHLLYGTPAS
jgi:hypothetical protein